jgi:hypothetical protein
VARRDQVKQTVVGKVLFHEGVEKGKCLQEELKNLKNEQEEVEPVPVMAPVPAPVAVVRPRGRGRPPKSAPANVSVPTGPSSQTRARVAYL